MKDACTRAIHEDTDKAEDEVPDAVKRLFDTLTEGYVSARTIQEVLALQSFVPWVNSLL